MSGWEAASHRGKGQASLDSEELYDGKPTIRMENAEADHTMAIQTIEVKPETDYRVTAYAKTEDIEPEEDGKNGACIGIRGTYELSKPFPMSVNVNKSTSR